MAKWLEQLRKNSETAQRGTLKTLKTHIGEVSKVLRVSSRAVSEKFPLGEETGLRGFDGFEGTPSEHLRNYLGEKSENGPETHPQNQQNPHCDHCQQYGATISKSIDWPDGPVSGTSPDSWHTVLAAMEGRSCPERISPDRWQEVISDAETFLARWGSAAHSLGWTALDLFGVHPTAPGRVDIMGLLLLIQGGAVVALTADAATIRRQTGAVLTYRRPALPGAVLISAVQS